MQGLFVFGRGRPFTSQTATPSRVKSTIRCITETGGLPSGEASGIVGVMPTRRSPDTISDLFSATPTAKPPEFAGVPPGKALPDNSAVQTRYLLPQDLAGALKGLDDTEVDSLFAAVTREAQRRGRLPRASASQAVTREDAGGSLTTGKLNAVRAAFKAGIKPSAIARQFGISQSDIRKALATEAQGRKPQR